jgi:hypothetical protein
MFIVNFKYNIAGRVALGSSVVAQGFTQAQIQRVHSEKRGHIACWRYHQ